MKIRRFLAGALFLSLLAGCGGGADDAGQSGGAGDGENTYTVAVVNFNGADEVTTGWTNMTADYIEEAFAEAGISGEVMRLDSQNDLSRQSDILENLIVQQVDCIIGCAFVDADGTVPYVKQCNELGIPVIGISAHLNDCSYYYVGSNDYQLGYGQAEFVADLLPENAKVLYMLNRPGAYNTPYREAGFCEGLAELRPDCEILAKQNVQGSDQGMQVMEDWITAYPDFDAVVAATDKAIGGAIEALKAANKLTDDLITVGLDADSIARPLIRDGLLTGSMAQDNEGLAKKAAEVCMELLEGGTPETDNTIDGYMVTLENINEIFGDA